MRIALALPLALASCTAVRLPAAEQASLDPIAFFEGRTYGTGTLKVVFDGTRPIAVESRGVRTADGLILAQTIHEGGKPSRTREWVIRRVGSGRYSGSLTEAEGAVSLVTRGPRATIRYRMKDGLTVEQQLALQADERTILNNLEVRKWGVRVARLRETIRKLS